MPDLFAGSGGTLTARAQANRLVFRMEPDPRYRDVIVQRWEKLTARKAKRRTAGVTV